MDVPHFAYPFIYWSPLGSFQVWVLMNRAAISLCVQVFCVFNSSGWIPRSMLLNCVIKLCLALQETPKHSFSDCATNNEEFLLLYILISIWYCQCLHFTHSVYMWEFIFISFFNGSQSLTMISPLLPGLQSPVISCCSVAKSCPTLCDPMHCITLGFPVLHYLPDLFKLMSIESVMPSNQLILCLTAS